MKVEVVRLLSGRGMSPERIEVPDGVVEASLAKLRRKGRRAIVRAVLAPVVVMLLSLVGLAAVAGNEPLPATVTVEVPNRVLPNGIAARELRIDLLEPLEFPDLVARVAELVGVEAVIEERPGRVFGGAVVLGHPVPFGLVMTGTVPAVLDEVARLSGYDWSWSEGRLVFFRYGDIEQRAAEELPAGIAVDVLAAVAAGEAEEQAAQVDGASELDGGTDGISREAGEASGAEMAEARRVASGVSGQVGPRPGGHVGAAVVRTMEEQAAAAEEESLPPAPPVWEVDPERHETVEGVLQAWSGRVGWNVAWQSERQFRVGAAAVFDGSEDEEEGFLKAADALLAVAPMRRSLVATVYPNRWLVIRDVGGEAR